MPYNCFGYPMMGYWGAGGWVGVIIMIIWWLIIIAAVILVVRWLVGQSGAGTMRGGKGPMDILRERYAKGEISKDEFEKMKKDLS